MKKLFLIVCLIAVHVTVFSQTDATTESRQLAREIISLQNISGSLPNFFRQVEISTRQQMTDAIKRDNSNLTIAQLDRVAQLYGAAVTQGIEAWMKNTLPKIEEAVTDLYIRRFSLQELQQLKDFHSSDVGKKSFSVSLEEIPALMAPLMKDAGAFGGSMGARFAEINMQLEKEGIKLQKK
jgi:hypothetical protein